MRTLFDKSAGADLDARSAPGGRGAGKYRVNPTLSASKSQAFDESPTGDSRMPCPARLIQKLVLG
jgi:hypothetical protein